MLKPLIVLSIFLSTSWAFSAENVVSNFYFPLNPVVLDSFMQDSVSGTMNKTIPGFSVSQPYATRVGDIHVSFDYTYKIHSDKRVGLSTEFSAQISNLKIAVGTVQTQDVERRQMGNVTLDVKIEGLCEGIELNPEAEALDLVGHLDLSNQKGSYPTVQAVLDSMEWPEDWDFSSPNCQGPAGYQEAVQGFIEESIVERQSEVEDLIQKEIDEVARKSLAQVMERVARPIDISVSDSVDINFQPHEVFLDSATGGVVLRGDVVASSKIGKEMKEQVLPFSLSDLALQQYQENTGLVMSNEFLNKVIDLVYRSGDLKKRFESQKISGLKKLHNSRFYQFFVFPDLMKFSKKANFLLDTFIGQTPKLQFNTQWEDRTWFQYQTKVKIKMLAPKPEGYLPYMYYMMPISGNLWLSVQNRHLVMGMGKPKSQFKSYWDGKYLKKYKTNRSFSNNLFHKEIDKTLQEQTFKIYLPSIDLDSDRSLKPIQLLSDNVATQLRYEIKTTRKLQAAK